MKERKIQLTGGSTYTVSLPKDWANELDVGTGDTVRLYPHDTQLIIEPAQTNNGAKEATVTVDDYSEEKVRRTVLAYYTSGFTTITLTDPTGFDRGRRVVAETARKLIGLEIVKSTDSQITLRNLLSSKTLSVEQSTNQMKQVALSMHADAVTALLEQDTGRGEHVSERDDQVDRLYAMTMRHFQRSLDNPMTTEELELGRVELFEYQTTARQFERIADHAVKIAELVKQFERPLPEEFAEPIDRAGETARDIVEQAATTIIDDGETETAHDALDRRDELITEINEIERDIHQRDVAESHLIALTLDSLTRTAEYAGNIAETSLKTAARTEQL